MSDCRLKWSDQINKELFDAAPATIDTERSGYTSSRAVKKGE